MNKIFCIILMLMNTVVFSSTGFRQGKLKDSYFAHGKDYSIFVDRSSISFIYTTPVQGKSEPRSIITRIDLKLGSATVIPENIIGTFNLLTGQGIRKLPEYRSVYVIDTDKDYVLSFENGSPVVTIIPRGSGYLDFSGAYAFISGDDKSYFLTDDILYPAPLIVQGMSMQEAYSRQMNIPFITQVSLMRWSTFLGGTVNDDILSVASSKSGLVYVCGSTQSSDLPATVGSFQDTLGGYYDAFVSCYTRSGLKRWTTYLGGSGLDIANSIDVDTSGNCILGGYTNSPGFPVVGNTMPINGSYDAFIAKFDSAGTALYSGFFGGSGGDFLYALSVDNKNNLFIGGGTTSQNLPVQSGSAQTGHAGAIDAYVTKFDRNFQLKWCTYLGGAGSEDMHAMNTDSDGSVIFCGGSYSPDFPTVNAFQSFPAGGADVYIAKLDSAGAIVFSTFYGGAAHDDAFGVVTDSLDNIYVTGFTPGNDLLIGTGAHQQVNNGGFDSFIIKLTSSGSFVKGTYYGGTSDDQAAGITFGENSLFIGGSTFSVDLPVDSTASQQMSAGGYDAFYAVFDTSLSYKGGSYFGDIGTETVFSISYDSVNTFYLAGKSTSAELPYSSFGNDDSLNGGEDGFLARINYRNAPNSSYLQVQKEENVLMYPVPVKDIVTLTSTVSIKSYRIVNLTGAEKVRRGIGKKEFSVDVSSYAAGTYIITLEQQDGKLLNRRFVKN